jgi:hypothetical protein
MLQKLSAAAVDYVYRLQLPSQCPYWLYQDFQPDSRGLGPAIYESDEPVVQILPVRVVDENESDLPGAPILLQVRSRCRAP